MPQAIKAFASFAAPIDAGRRQARPEGSAAPMSMPLPTDQAEARTAKRTTEAECIVEALVNQYFGRSTNTSGIFRCW